jgi:ABC-type multidrug transport system fused ATPase/permease subunit
VPISAIGHVVPQLIASLSSLRRIQMFLRREEKIITPEVPPHSQSSNEKVTHIDTSSVSAAIVLTDASFAPSQTGEILLRGVNAVFQPGSLTMLVGPVGSVSTIPIPQAIFNMSESLIVG